MQDFFFAFCDHNSENYIAGHRCALIYSLLGCVVDISLKLGGLN